MEKDATFRELLELLGGDYFVENSRKAAVGATDSVWLKIRRYLVPWGFDSPSRHQLP